eukprot:Skav208425  [mRNA]  locus=scaffold2953:336083:341342:+ [translate_table: standard]
MALGILLVALLQSTSRAQDEEAMFGCQLVQTKLHLSEEVGRNMRSDNETNGICFPSLYEAVHPSNLNVSSATSFVLWLPDNRSLVTRDRKSPYDDLYCYVNGWYSLPRRAEVVSNFSYLEELSDSWCDHLATIVPGYYNLSMADMQVETLSNHVFLKDLMKNGATEGYVELKLLTLAEHLDMSSSTVEPRNAQLLDHIDARRGP